MVKKTKKKSKKLKRTINKRRKTKNLRGGAGAGLRKTTSSKSASHHQWKRTEIFPYSKGGNLGPQNLHRKDITDRVLYFIIDARNIFPKRKSADWPRHGNYGTLRDFLYADFYGKGKNIYQYMRECKFNRLSLIICDFEDFSKPGSLDPQRLINYIREEIRRLIDVNTGPLSEFNMNLEYTYLIGLSAPQGEEGAHTNKKVIDQQDQMKFYGPTHRGKYDQNMRKVTECTWVDTRFAKEHDWHHELCGIDDHLAVLVQKRLQSYGAKNILLSDDRKMYLTSNMALANYYSKKNKYYEFYNSIPILVFTDNNNLGLDKGGYISTFGEILYSLGDGDDTILGSISSKKEKRRDIDFNRVRLDSSYFRENNIVNIIIYGGKIDKMIKFEKGSIPPVISKITGKMSDEYFKRKINVGFALVGVNGEKIEGLSFTEIMKRINITKKPITLQFKNYIKADINPKTTKKTTAAVSTVGAATGAASGSAVVMGGPAAVASAVAGATVPTTLAGIAPWATTAAAGLAASPVTVPAVVAGATGLAVGLAARYGLQKLKNSKNDKEQTKQIRMGITRDVSTLMASWGDREEFTDGELLILKDLKSSADMNGDSFSMNRFEHNSIKEFLEARNLYGTDYNLYNYPIPDSTPIEVDEEGSRPKRGTIRGREEDVKPLERTLLGEYDRSEHEFAATASERVKMRRRGAAAPPKYTTSSSSEEDDDDSSDDDDEEAAAREQGRAEEQMAEVEEDKRRRNYIGRRIHKQFQDYGDTVFLGNVLDYDGLYFTINYTDGDRETMLIDELESYLVPVPFPKMLSIYDEILDEYNNYEVISFLGGHDEELPRGYKYMVKDKEGGVHKISFNPEIDRLITGTE